MWGRSYFWSSRNSHQLCRWFCALDSSNLSKGPWMWHDDDMLRQANTSLTSPVAGESLVGPGIRLSGKSLHIRQCEVYSSWSSPWCSQLPGSIRILLNWAGKSISMVLSCLSLTFHFELLTWLIRATLSFRGIKAGDSLEKKSHES